MDYPKDEYMGAMMAIKEIELLYDKAYSIQRKQFKSLIKYFGSLFDQIQISYEESKKFYQLKYSFL